MQKQDSSEDKQWDSQSCQSSGVTPVNIKNIPRKQNIDFLLKLQTCVHLYN